MKQLKLSDVAEISSGLALKGGLKKAENGTLVVTMADVAGNTQSIDWKKVKRGEVSVRSHQPLRNGDILFLAKGIHYKAVVIEGLEEAAIATLHFFIIRPNAEIDSKYLAFQLNSKKNQQYFADNARGNIKKHITRSVIDECEVGISTTSTQVKIIDIQEKVGEALKEFASAKAVLEEACELFTQGLYKEAESKLINLQNSHYWGVFEADALLLQSLISHENIESLGNQESRKRKLL